MKNKKSLIAERKEFIILNHKKLTAKQIAKKLNVSINKVFTYINIIGIKTIPERKKWTSKDVLFLTKNAGLMPVQEISEKLERTEAAIDKKARKLNLSLSFYYEKAFDINSRIKRQKAL